MHGSVRWANLDEGLALGVGKRELGVLRARCVDGDVIESKSMNTERLHLGVLGGLKNAVNSPKVTRKVDTALLQDTNNKSDVEVLITKVSDIVWI